MTLTHGMKPPGHLTAMQLSDGRILVRAECEPTDSPPVVPGSGEAMSRRLGFGADDLGDLGVRLC